MSTIETDAVLAQPVSDVVQAYDAGYDAGYAAGFRAKPKPKPRAIRKPKPSTCVAGMLKIKFTSLMTASGEIEAWRAAMPPVHGPVPEYGRIPQRIPGRVTGPLLVHNGTSITDEKTARQYVKSL